jgi:hypothetical protein
MSEGMSLYSEAQLRALFWSSYPSCLLSIVGSGVILYLVVREWKDCSSYSRIMLGLAGYDFMFALGTILFKSWTVPEESGLAYLARGNILTCNINAFFTNMLLGAYWYTAFLAIFFALTIRFEVTRQTIAKYWEPVFHLVPTLVTLFSAVFGFTMGTFNPLDELAGFCWLGEYPPRCTSGEVECIRGGKDTMEYEVSLLLSYGTVFTTLVALIGSMLLIVIRVWSTERRLKKYSHGASSQWKRTKESGIQALLFIGCLVISVCPLLAIQISPRPTTTENADFYFAFSMAASILTPLTGAMNSLIYIRPRYRALTGPNGPLNMSTLRPRSNNSQNNSEGLQNRQAIADEISRDQMAQSQHDSAESDSFHCDKPHELP